jgi:hypothetical protein
MMHDALLTTPCAWRPRFEALVAARMHTPFAWGVHDCCLWAADCVLTITGVDHAADLRGTYSAALEAQRVLVRLGGIEAVAARAGPRIGPFAAAVGDVGLIALDDRALLAVCVGAFWLAPAAKGLAAHSLDVATAAWSVHHA